MRKQVVRAVLISMFATLCCAGGAGATTWIVPDQEEMLQSADAVVLATVSDLRSVEAFDGSQISTQVTLRVHESYKGAAAGTKAEVRGAGELRRSLKSLNADAVQTPHDETAGLWDAVTNGDSTAAGIAHIWLDGTRKATLVQLTTVPLLIIDDLGMRKLPATAAEDLLEIVMRRYERASTLITSNRPVEDWGKLLGDTAAVTALLDRLLHHAHVLTCGPRSWRTRLHGDRAAAGA